eukprot:COSAG06_NODE_3396_length_5405_cov_6.327554_5_plen_44_part_00
MNVQDHVGMELQLECEGGTDRALRGSHDLYTLHRHVDLCACGS